MATPLTLRGVKGLRLTETEGDNNFKAATIQIADVATLKTLEGDFDGQQVNLAGYYTNGDGGGQPIYWDSASTDTANDGTIFQATGVVTGRWKSVDTSVINVKEWGAKGDGATDDYTICQACITYAQSIVSPLALPGSPDSPQPPSIYFPAGTYYISETLLITEDNITLYGDSWQTSRILAGGNRLTADALVKFQGTALLQLRRCTISSLMLYTPNDNSLRRDRGLTIDFCEHVTISEMYIDSFGLNGLSLLSAFEGHYSDLYFSNCGAIQGAGDPSFGVIYIGPSTIFAAQGNNSTFYRISLTSNWGTEIKMNNTAETNSNIVFDGVYHENAPDSDAGSVSNLPHISIDNSANVHFSNFVFAFSNAFAYTATGIEILKTVSNTKNISFTNGLIILNRTAAPVPIQDLVSTQVPVSMTDVGIWDLDGVLPGACLQSAAHADAEWILHNVQLESPDPITTVIQGSATIQGDYSLQDRNGAGPVVDYINKRQTFHTLTVNSTVPSVKHGSTFITANTTGTIISTFADGEEGMEVKITVNDANTTFAFASSGLKGNGGVDYVAKVNDSLFCVRNPAGTWNCTLNKS